MFTGNTANARANTYILTTRYVKANDIANGSVAAIRDDVTKGGIADGGVSAAGCITNLSS